MPGRDIDPRFGERMRELMRSRGTSYRALAARAYQSSSALHRLATGQTAPDPELAQLLDAALDARGELVALAQPPRPVDVAPSRGQTGEVMRRSLLTAIAALGLDQAAPTVVQILAGLAEQSQHGSTADDWLEAAWEYGYSYVTRPRSETLREATADLAALHALLPAAKSTERAGLHEAGARLAGLVAMACTDLGHQREARHTWRMARRLAAESGSIDCAMWVRGQEATLGLYSGRPLPTLLALADEGLGIGQTAAVAGVAELHAARAQTLTRLGRADDALAELIPLRHLVDAHSDMVTTAPGSIYGWPPYRLAHVESFVRATAGDAPAAHRAHDAARAAIPRSHETSQCQIELHRSARLVRDGAVLEGIARAAGELAALPSHAHGRFVLALADDVIESVPPAMRDLDGVAELRSLVAV